MVSKWILWPCEQNSDILIAENLWMLVFEEYKKYFQHSKVDDAVDWDVIKTMFYAVGVNYKNFQVRTQ